MNLNDHSQRTTPLPWIVNSEAVGLNRVLWASEVFFLTLFWSILNCREPWALLKYHTRTLLSVHLKLILFLLETRSIAPIILYLPVKDDLLIRMTGQWHLSHCDYSFMRINQSSPLFFLFMSTHNFSNKLILSSLAPHTFYYKSLGLIVPLHTTFSEQALWTPSQSTAEIA